MKAYIYSLIFLIGISLNGCFCCPSEEYFKIKFSEYEITEVNVWLNLMPGSPAKFHFTAEEIVKSRYPLEELFFNFESINIYQSGIIIYTFLPKTSIVKQSIDDKGMNIYLLELRLDEGLPLNEKINRELNVDVEFIFPEEFDKENIMIKNVELVKAY